MRKKKERGERNNETKSLFFFYSLYLYTQYTTKKLYTVYSMYNFFLPFFFYLYTVYCILDHI